MQDQDTLPWYKQFWPWFIIALPATAVLASFHMMYLAINGADTLVNDDYYKEGLAINQQLASDANAKKLGLQANLKIDDLTGEVLVSLTGQLPSKPNTLLLEFIHPLNQSRDKELTLKLAPGGDYIGQMPSNARQRWYVELSGTIVDSTPAVLMAAADKTNREENSASEPAASEKADSETDVQKWRLKGELDLKKSFELQLGE